MTLPVQTMAITVPIPIPTGRPAPIIPMAEKSKRFFQNPCSFRRFPIWVWDDVPGQNPVKMMASNKGAGLVRCRENPVEDGDKGAKVAGTVEFSFQQYDPQYDEDQIRHKDCGSCFIAKDLCHRRTEWR